VKQVVVPKGVLPEKLMHKDMNKQTKEQLLAKLRRRYATAGRKHKIKLIDQAVELLGYHRKAAIRALRVRAQARRPAAQPVGRPRLYEPEVLLPVLKPIWLAAYQPCGGRLAALLPEWLPAYEEDHKRLDGGLRECLLAASARTLDRLLTPLRAKASRRGGTRPGSLLRNAPKGIGKLGQMFWKKPLFGHAWMISIPAARAG
jgi:hypothetical protein